MIPGECIRCLNFPCEDVNHQAYHLPGVEVVSEQVSIVLISESAPNDPADDYYARGDPLFAKTTVLAFQDAGARVASIRDILELGVYLTTAIKCGKTGYGIKLKTIDECSRLLEQELALFPNVKVFLLMGDAAIRAVNTIARRAGEAPVIPAGSTYKIRGAEYRWRGGRAFPSYLQAGLSFFIEKSKRLTIAEDIASALALAQQSQ